MGQMGCFDLKSKLAKRQYGFGIRYFIRKFQRIRQPRAAGHVNAQAYASFSSLLQSQYESVAGGWRDGYRHEHPR